MWFDMALEARVTNRLTTFLTFPARVSVLRIGAIPGFDFEQPGSPFINLRWAVKTPQEGGGTLA